MLRRILKILGSIAVVALIIVLAYQSWLAIRRNQRPEHTPLSAQLFEGVSYERVIRTTPRPLDIHIITIAIYSPNVRFFVTPGDDLKGMEVQAHTTSDFLQTYGVQVAINGSYFEPFRAGRLPWDYYPHSGDPVDVTGLAISNGRQYSKPEGSNPNVCLGDSWVSIQPSRCPQRTLAAVAGNQLLVWEGASLDLKRDQAMHPRTAVALDARRRTLWLLVIDGRQNGYSEGVTLAELANMAQALGADVAVNLDGGGSSTLVIDGADGPQVVNAPIHQHIPMQERPVANHLGVFAAKRKF